MYTIFHSICPVARFGLLSPGTRKFWISSEKEFKDRHRESCSNRFISAKQRCHLQTGGPVGSKKSTALWVPRPQAFIRVCREGSQSWKTGSGVVNLQTGLRVINSSHVLSRGSTWPWMVRAVSCSSSFYSFPFFFFFKNWGLNSGPHICWTHALPLEVCLQTFGSGYFGDRLWLFALTGLDQSSLFYVSHHS
jgi:hypothetical protein